MDDGGTLKLSLRELALMCPLLFAWLGPMSCGEP